MSIKGFSNQPCPACGKDTMHLHMKCQECGHINLTQTQQRSQAFKRRLLGRVQGGMSADCALAHMHMHDREHAAVKRKIMAAIPSRSKS